MINALRRPFAALFLVGLSLSLSAHAATLTRQPYLQSSTQNSIVIRWRTDVATDSRVRYGTTQGTLNLTKSDSASVTEHEVKLTGLSADTKYFYTVGSSSADLSAIDANHYFFTNPVPGAAKACRIWVIGDFGNGSTGQANVRDTYAAYTGSTRTNVWLMLGDNAYADGTDAEYQSKVFNVYSNLFKNTVAWPTLGNHDDHTVASNGVAPYFNIFTLPTAGESGGVASGSEHYYSFDYGPIHFICLDSQGVSRSATSPMATWLTSDLQNTTQKFIIAYWHHPPYTKGTHDSDSAEMRDMRLAFNPILEANGVDLVLGGHSHVYERTYLIDGHYGIASTWSDSFKIDGGSGSPSTPYSKTSGSHKGAVYSVVGCSGASGTGTLNHPANFISLGGVVGSVVIDCNGTDRLDVKFLKATSASAYTVSDTYTIIKATAPVITGQPANKTVTAGQTANFSITASGTPTPTYQWQVSTDGTTWTNVSTGTGGTTASYTTAAIVAADNNKKFRCIATNSAGSATSNAATLTVNTNVAPTITAQPANKTVTAGQTANFSITASGTPTPTYQWQVSTDGTTWTNVSTGTGGTTASYTTAATVAADNNKKFRCIATNSAGSATSNAATLTVNTSVAPTITAQPANKTVTAGQTANFSIAASGTPTPTYQWQVSTDGTTWTNVSTGTGGTTASYTTAATVAADNNKRFRCIATNSAGSATSNAATLTVNSNVAPTITAQPANKTVTAGQTANFSITASGTPIPTYQWQVSTDGTTWTNVSTGTGGTTASYTTVATVAADNNKKFRCIATNSAGSATSNAATLTVNTNVAPTITAQPVNKTVTAGQTANFSITASGTPTPTYQWQVSTDGTTWTNVSTGTGGTTASYTTAATVAADNNKKFRCIVTNSAGSATSNAATLTVNVPNSPPAIASTASASPNPALVNEAISFIVSATDANNDPLTYSWDFGDGTSASGSSASHAYAVAQSYTAVVTVSDGKGGAVTSSVTVTVNSVPPAINVKINFQMSSSVTPSGYLPDSGAVFGDRGNGYSYGWNSDVTIDARDRNAANSPDQRYDTLVHMQKATSVFWEIALPNGSYTVRAVCGDPSYYNSVYNLNVENVLTVSGTPTATIKWLEGTQTVNVADGRLTLSCAAGSNNNKLCFVEIATAAARDIAAADIMAEPLVVKQLSARMNFKLSGRDSYRVSGVIPSLAADFKPEGTMASIDVGAAISGFTLNKKGSAKSKSGSFALRLSKKLGWTFRASLVKGAWSDEWSDGGLENTTVQMNAELPVTLTIGNKVFGGSKVVKYKASKSKSGAAR